MVVFDWLALVMICAAGVGVVAILSPLDHSPADVKVVAACAVLAAVTVVALLADMLITN